MEATLEQRVTELEKRVAALEVQVQAQPKVINNCTAMNINRLAEELSQHLVLCTKRDKQDY